MDADSEASVHTNTQQNLLMEMKIQHRLLFTFHRMMKIQSDDKTRYRVRLHHLAGNHPDQISKSAKYKRSNFRRKTYRMDFEHGRKHKENSLDLFLHKNVYKVPGSSSENRNRFFQPSPENNVSSPSVTTSK